VIASAAGDGEEITREMKRLAEAGHWPDLTVTWDVLPEEDPAVMDAILDILFRAPEGPRAA
jgi:hypothetical protein